MNELQRSGPPYAGPRDPIAEPALTAQDFALIFWRRLWLVALITAVSTLTAVILSSRTPKAWRSSAQVLLVQRAPMMAASSQAVASAPMIESIDTQITLLQSRELAKQAAAKVGVSAETLQNATAITPRKDGDDVIDVAVEADSRQHAILWADALCAAFVQYKKQVSQSNSEETLNTLQSQAAQAKKQMDAADARLLAFQQTHNLGGIGILDPQAQKTAALNAVLAQDAVVASFQNDYATAQARAASLGKQLQQANAAISTGTGVRDNSEVLKLQEDLNDLERERAQTATRYKLKFPSKLGPLDAQIADTRTRLNQSIQTLQTQPSLTAQSALQDASDSARSEAAADSVKLHAAIQQRDLLRAQTTDLPRIGMAAEKLMEGSDQAHKLYNSLNAAAQAARLDRDAASGNVQIVQPAFAPEDAIRPSHKRDMLLGLGVGLCLSLLAILLLEQADRTLRTVADVRRLAEGPVVAVLPQMARAQRTLLLSGETPPHLIETYNAVRANLSLAMRQKTGVDLDDHQVILVTSALPGEGKSLTASELAQSFARAGRRVVLVNGDMRRSSHLPLLKPLDTSGPGLAEVLSGSVPVADALLQTETANLSVLHCGHATKNPMDLISQPLMAEMIKTLRDMADVVILDSPPAAVVADALLLAPHADCVLYVVGVGMVNSEAVRHTAASLTAASPKMLAYFVNRVPHIMGEPTSYTYADYGRTSFTTPQEGKGREYTDSRTLVLERYATTEAGIVTEAPLFGDTRKSNGTKSPLRVLPKTGTHLSAVEGPYTGQNFALSPNKPLTLGALPDRDIVLARDQTISKIQAHIALEEGSYVVYNDSTTNPTLINEIAISRQALAVGDILVLGASKFRYE